MKSILEVLKEVTLHLESIQLDYMVVGSVASMVYGVTRSTLDIDLVVQIKSIHLNEFSKAFTQPDYYCPPQEVLVDEISRQGLFNLIHIKSGIKIDIILVKDQEFNKTEFARKKKISFMPGMEFYVASPEDVIIKKLYYYREGQSDKHLSDIRGIISFTKVDHDYIQFWVHKMKLESEWSKIK